MLETLCETVTGFAGEDGVRILSILGGLLTAVLGASYAAWRAAKVAFQGSLAAYRWATKETPLSDEAAAIADELTTSPGAYLSGDNEDGVRVGGVVVNGSGRVFVGLPGAAHADMTDRFKRHELRSIVRAMKERRATLAAAKASADRKCVAEAARGNAKGPAKG